MDQNKVRQLQEMGFSQAQAESALKRTSYDVERAIAYLFGEPLEFPEQLRPVTTPEPNPPPPSSPRQNQLIRYQDTVNINNPEDIPNFPSFSEFSSGVNSNMQSGSNVSTSDSGSITQFSIYDHYNGIQRDDFTPPVILPYRIKSPQNFFLPILIIVSSLKEFTEKVLNKCDFDYGYVENWYSNQYELNAEVPEGVDQSLYKFVLEVQKLLGFLNQGLSKRVLISGRNLLTHLRNDFYVSIHSETSDEVFKKIFTYLTQTIDQVLQNNESNSIGSIFNSVVTNDDNDIELSVIHLDPDTRGTTITESLNTIFWNSDDSLGQVSFAHLAPILTFHVLNYDDGDYQPMKLEEYFYPGVYGTECMKLVSDMSNKRLDIAKERNLVSNRIMSLNSFEGKNIKHILQKSIDYLASTGTEEESKEDLIKLSNNLKEETVLLTDRVPQINLDYLQLDINNHENILNKLHEDPSIKPPEKYILIGIILSDSEYLYKTKTYCKTPDEDWVYFSATATPDNIVNDFRMETMNFESVNVFFTEATRNSNESFTFIYGSESKFNEQEHVKIGDKLVEFFQKDNEYLLQEITRLTKESEQDLEISSEEEDEASSMQETPNPEGANPEFRRRQPLTKPKEATESSSDAMLVDL